MFLNKNKLGIAWTLLILLVCLMPGDNLPGSSFLSFIGVDKLIHGFLYAVLMVLVGKGLIKQFDSSYSRNKMLIVAFLYCLFLGIGIEFVQNSFVSGRSGDVFDVLANNIGAFIGFLFIVFQLKRKTEKSK
jgi:VanZ family protein